MLLILSLTLFGGDVADLGSESFPVREAAQRRLERHAWLSWRACDLGTLSADLERRRRCDRVVRQALRVDPCPPICAPLVVDRVICEEGEWLRLPRWAPLVIGRGEDAPPFPDWYRGDVMRSRTHAVAIVAIRAGVPPTAVQAGLDRLARYDRPCR